MGFSSCEGKFLLKLFEGRDLGGAFEGNLDPFLEGSCGSLLPIKGKL